MASAGNCSMIGLFCLSNCTRHASDPMRGTDANTVLTPRTRDHEIQNETTSFQNERSLCLTHAHGAANVAHGLRLNRSECSRHSC